jgi:DNA-binding transcriptional LysR family regulator
MDVHVRDLRYFVAVAEELHFTRAAERLFVSQPALSKQIRQLEQSLRVQLFRRDRRSVELTSAGDALFPLAKQLVDAWDEAPRAVADAAARESATLIVGFSTSVGRSLLPGAMAAFSELHPNWDVHLRQVDWADATGGLADASTDIAFLWLPVPRPVLFRRKVVATEPRWVALREGHPLLGREVINFSDLLDEPFLALPTSAGPARDHWLAIDERLGRSAHIAAEVMNADETFEAVANGTGIVLLSAGNAEIYRREGVIARPVEGLGPSELAVVWRADDARSVVRDFVDGCRGVAA